MNPIKSLLKFIVPGRLREGLRLVQSHYRSGITSNLSFIRKLELYYPNSGNYWLFPNLTLESANNLPRNLSRLLGKAGIVNEDISIEQSTAFSHQPELATRLATLFVNNGSDKSTGHDYHLVYSQILFELGVETQLSLLEIGLGTNHPELISSMGVSGIPGASVRAFRDFLPNANIFGADVDKGILFSEQRIQTVFVDQLVPATFEQLKTTFNQNRFDLIIDDGLHSIEANLNTLIFSMDALNAGGWVVIEDIPHRTLDVWFLVRALFARENRKCGIIDCKSGYIFYLKSE